MTGIGLLAAAVLVIAVAVAVAVVARPVRATGLGLVHPVLAWLALETWFFGFGSIVLAVADGIAGPALYLAGCLVATAIGAVAAHRLTTGRMAPVGPPMRVAMPSGVWRWMPILLAIASVGLLLPLLVRIGLPLLTQDATGARVEISGLVVQPLRVALPGLVCLLVLAIATRATMTGRRWLDLAIVIASVAFTLALASRYLAVELLAAAAIAWVLAGRRLPARVIALGGLAAIIVFVGVGLTRAPAQIGADPLGSTIERTTSRLFMIQPRTLAALQDAIPGETPFFGGRTWLRQIGPLIGGDDIPNLGYWIYPRVVEGDQAVAGYAAPGLIGEVWANLGPLGIAVFGPFGAILGLAGELIARHRSRAVDIASGAMLVLFFARTHALGLLGVGVLVVLILAWRLVLGPRAVRGRRPADPASSEPA